MEITEEEMFGKPDPIYLPANNPYVLQFSAWITTLAWLNPPQYEVRWRDYGSQRQERTFKSLEEAELYKEELYKNKHIIMYPRCLGNLEDCYNFWASMGD